VKEGQAWRTRWRRRSSSRSGGGDAGGRRIDGRSAAMLASVAEFYEEDVQTALGAAMALIEPLILTIMAVLWRDIDFALYADIHAGANVH